MGQESTCELVEFKVESASFINIDPRPRKDSPQDLEQTLLELVKRDRTYRDDGARKAMLGIFEVVGTRSELADSWRKKLAMELYK